MIRSNPKRFRARILRRTFGIACLALGLAWLVESSVRAAGNSDPARDGSNASASVPGPSGGGFEITRSTIDGGGVMFSTGGDFELSGTIGQPDAGAMAGGDFELTGGFWFQIPPGDCEDDGDVDLFDHALFEQCLLGPAAAVNAGCECFDRDRSGSVDLRDAATAQAAFTGS